MTDDLYKPDDFEKYLKEAWGDIEPEPDPGDKTRLRALMAGTQPSDEVINWIFLALCGYVTIDLRNNTLVLRDKGRAAIT